MQPNNLEAEQGLLGVLLTDNRQIDRVADILRPAHFYSAAHQRIYQGILHFFSAGKQVDYIVLKNFFADDPDLQNVGGSDYLRGLAYDTPGINGAMEYAETVINTATRRTIIGMAETMIEKARTLAIDGPTPLSLIEEAEAALYELHKGADGNREARAIADIMHDTITLIERAQKGEFIGIPTGLTDLDEQLGGLRPGEMTIAAGRPGMGKTALGLTVAVNAARAGFGVGVQSIEMGDCPLVQRLLARSTGMAVGQQLRPGAIHTDGFRRLIEAGQTLGKLPIWIDQSGTITAAQIRARARRLKRRNPSMALLVVDYLGLVKGSDPRAQRVHQLGEVSKTLKATAKDLDIHVMVLAQVNRGVEGREDKRCSISDLRDSGEIEEDADIIIFPYREEYYLKESRPKRKVGEGNEKFHERLADWENRMDACQGKAQISIGKFRQGSAHTVECGFNGARQYFHDLNQTEGSIYGF